MKQTHLLPGWSGWLRMMTAAVALVAAIVPQRSHAEPVAPGLRNIVLVHGAFADGSSWTEVIAALQRKGYHVTAVQQELVKETGAHHVTLKSSHMSMVSHPADIARLIDRAARDSSR